MEVSKALHRAGIVPVITFTDTSQAAPLARALVENGLAVAEVTLRNPCALDCIAIIHEQFPDVLLGAGTVFTVAEARQAVAAGASFIVCPCLVGDVIAWCLANNVAVFPGVCTPTEVFQAKELGLKNLKFFPASSYGGVDTLKSLKAVFGDMSFMPTGGITLNNCEQYLRTPGVICCGGTFVAPTSLMEGGDFEKIGEIAGRTVALVNEIRKTPSAL